MILFATLVVEHRLLKPQLTLDEINKLAKIDAIYGASAGVVLIAGLCLWFLFGKGSAFYSHNPIFHAKVGLFVLVGLISIYPTIFFINARKRMVETIVVPKAIVMIVKIEMLLLAIIPLLGIAMAQGYGLVP